MSSTKRCCQQEKVSSDSRKGLGRKKSLVVGRGELYSGQVCQSERDGYGIYLFRNGDAYAGEWRQNQRHGWGFLIRSVGAKYEGTWFSDQQTGFGIQSQGIDNRYIGEFLHNRRHGRGILVQANGLLYAGRWQMGEPLSRRLLFQPSDSDAADANSDHTAAESDAQDPGLSERSTSSKYLMAALEGADPSGQEEEDVSSSSSSLTPIFGENDLDHLTVTERIKRPVAFAKKFREVQAASNVSALRHWSISEISHLLRCSGMSEETSDLFVKHKISGAYVEEILEQASESLVDIGVDNPYSRRFIELTFATLVRIKRRCDTDRDTVPAVPEAHIISTRGLYLERRVGEGGYGRVYRGRYEFDGGPIGGVPEEDAAELLAARNENVKVHRDSSIPVAVKVFRLKTVVKSSRFRRNGTADIYGRLQRQQRSMVRDFNAEVNILSRLRHPNVTLFLGAITFPLYCIVTEYVPCGSLFDLLHRHKRQLSLPQIVRIAKELCCACSYLHSQSIIHCDIKSSNILLSDNGSVKLCDFGLATSIASETGSKDLRSLSCCRMMTEKPAMLGCIGTHQWMSPEVMRGEASTKASDVYSFGVIFWEMLTRQIPYKDLPLPHITAWVGYGGHAPFEYETAVARALRSGKRGANSVDTGQDVQLDVSDQLEGLPASIVEILHRCLSPTPWRRPSFNRLCQAFKDLKESSVLDVEENLKSFLGL